MPKHISFSRAGYEGGITGPSDWTVVNELGEPIDPYPQDFGHTQPGRWVRLAEDGFRIASVIDYQDPILVERIENGSDASDPIVELLDAEYRLFSNPTIYRHQFGD